MFSLLQISKKKRQNAMIFTANQESVFIATSYIPYTKYQRKCGVGYDSKIKGKNHLL